MNKTFIIIEREFLTRVRKKSFLLTTFLTPIALAALMLIPTYIATLKDNEHKEIAVIDHSGLASSALENSEYTTYTFEPAKSLDSLKKNFKQQNLYAVLEIGQLQNNELTSVNLYAQTQTNLDVQHSIEQALRNEVERHKLEQYNIAGLDTILTSIKSNVNVSTIMWDEYGKEKRSYTGVYMGIAIASGMLIYFFIFMFGNMVMRGVIEEKSNRIMEVLVSSVKPFELMMGKILGIAAVGLLQFALWILLTLGIVAIAQLLLVNPAEIMAAKPAIADSVSMMAAGGDPAQMTSHLLPSNVADILNSINFTAILTSFLLYFLLGYLLYASLFAAVGSAVENETDTQQLVLPITVPIILGIFITMHTFNYPNSALSFWGSIIPFTSPMVMMARVPFGVPLWQLALSLGLLALTFVGVVWVAGKIYHTGVLMYGKRPSFKEIWRWIRHS
ncbi:MAG: ABC transporter permease [Prevotellaceae bacterium]|jgi:ABC-2 type transport system permease protein|nr:ABC transporter permease [Prevotellaceae bacterium]